MRTEDYACGMSFWHPKWLQKYATTKWFLGVYGLLGTVQAMSYLYFVVTLTTIEKRFHMPSQTTGIVLSGNEISQICLSLILSYVGGQRNRPLWIAWGMVFCGLSCFVLAAPHFIYGSGDEAYYLTKEYYDFIGQQSHISLINGNQTSGIDDNQPVCKTGRGEEKCEDLLNVVPLILIFLSQFILGIGNTLYYSLGQTYLDDNTKKRNTPIMLAYAMTLRMIGPIFGFLLGFLCLNMYIDPSKTPLIEKDDPRWLGAWWFGWILLGTALLMFSGLIALFPKKLPKSNEMLYDSYQPKALLTDNGQYNEDAKSKSDSGDDIPKLKDFPKALRRLLTNKLIMYNNISACFYLLGASGYMTFMARYMEVQFHRSSQNATILIGPLTLLGIVSGLFISGLVISKWRPRASKVLFWNVIIGLVYMAGQFVYMSFYCGDTQSMIRDGVFNLTSTCNQNCHCDGVAYSPVCHEETGQTFFSACHAGCRSWNKKENTYSNCTCFESTDSSSTPSYLTLLSTLMSQDLSTQQVPSITNAPSTNLFLQSTATEPATSFNSFEDILKSGACMEGCEIAFYSFTILSLVINSFGSSGRIGNILVNYRAVSAQDKSFAQGLTLMMISLFAAIPGPIIFGRAIDSTCLVWNYQCGERGDCQLYDQTKYRYYVNTLAITLTFLGALFDFLVWFYGRDLDLYGEAQETKAKELEAARRRGSEVLLQQTQRRFDFD